MISMLDQPVRIFMDTPKAGYFKSINHHPAFAMKYECCTSFFWTAGTNNRFLLHSCIQDQTGCLPPSRKKVRLSIGLNNELVLWPSQFRFSLGYAHLARSTITKLASPSLSPVRIGCIKIVQGAVSSTDLAKEPWVGSWAAVMCGYC